MAVATGTSYHYFTVVWALMVAVIFAHLSNCQTEESIVILPSSTQFIPEGFSGNVTYQCNVSVTAGNPTMATAVWSINGLQIVPSRTSELESFGIFIVYDQTMATISLDDSARSNFQSLGLVCAVLIPGPPPSVVLGQPLDIVTYGRPGIPNPAARVRSSDPTIIEWGTPPNLTSVAPVSYTVTASSNIVNINRTFIVNETQLSLEGLEREVMNITRANNLCQEFNFTVVASLEGVADSDPAISTDIIPNSIDVGPVNNSLGVFSVEFKSSSISVGFSFQAAGTCSRTLPITKYYVSVDGERAGSFGAPVGVAMINEVVELAVSQNRRFSVAIEACSSVVCRTSSSTSLNSTDVQSAEVVFFENNILLTCRFANGSSAQGCVFVFEANLNGTGAPTEEFTVARSGHLGNQCNASANQRNGYMSFSVYDLEQNGQRGSIQIPVLERVLDTEQEYTDQTQCVVMRDVVRDRTAVAIAVPLIIVFFLIVLVVGVLIFLRCYYLKNAKYHHVKNRNPRLAEADSEDDLELIIDSNNADIVKEPMPARIKPYESLRPGTQVQTDGSLKGRRAPVEVELDHDQIRLRVNKSALKAVARFHMLVKKQQSGASIAGSGSLDKASMMALNGHAPSRVKFSKKLCEACDDLHPDEVREVENDQEGLKSWAIFQYDHQPETPPESLPTSPIAWPEEKIP